MIPAASSSKSKSHKTDPIAEILKCKDKEMRRVLLWSRRQVREYNGKIRSDDQIKGPYWISQTSLTILDLTPALVCFSPLTARPPLPVVMMQLHKEALARQLRYAIYEAEWMELLWNPSAFRTPAGEPLCFRCHASTCRQMPAAADAAGAASDGALRALRCHTSW